MYTFQQPDQGRVKAITERYSYEEISDALKLKEKDLDIQEELVINKDLPEEQVYNTEEMIKEVSAAFTKVGTKILKTRHQCIPVDGIQMWFYPCLSNGLIRYKHDTTTYKSSRRQSQYGPHANIIDLIEDTITNDTKLIKGICAKLGSGIGMKLEQELDDILMNMLADCNIDNTDPNDLFNEIWYNVDLSGCNVGH